MRIKEWLRLFIPSQIHWLPRYYTLFKKVDFRNERSILDAGCGEGIVVKELMDRKLKACGVDISPRSIEKAQKNYGKDFFLTADVCHLPFKNETFSLIYSLDVLESVKDIGCAFREFNRVLKPGGRLVIHVAQVYTNSAMLFSAQRVLRKLVPAFLRTYSFSGNKSWFNITDEQMKEHFGHVKIYSLDELMDISREFFTVSHWDSSIKLFAALATDITYGIKGFHYLRPLFFGVAVRLDWYLFKKMPGYALFVEFVKK